MLKYAVIFLINSLVAGALGLTNVSAIAKRISLILFALFFVVFLILLGFALLVGEAIDHAWLMPATLALIEAREPRGRSPSPIPACRPTAARIIAGPPARA
jgi:uncharacterized membrane protein YtjA (UPF0391 family)